MGNFFGGEEEKNYNEEIEMDPNIVYIEYCTS
jgi:hypothetical protein